MNPAFSSILFVTEVIIIWLWAMRQYPFWLFPHLNASLRGTCSRSSASIRVDMFFHCFHCWLLMTNLFPTVSARSRYTTYHCFDVHETSSGKSVIFHLIYPLHIQSLAKTIVGLQHRGLPHPARLCLRIKFLFVGPRFCLRLPSAPPHGRPLAIGCMLVMVIPH